MSREAMVAQEDARVGQVNLRLTASEEADVDFLARFYGASRGDIVRRYGGQRTLDDITTHANELREGLRRTSKVPA